MSSSRPTVAEIRAVTQPPEIVTRANSEHWLGIPYFRKVSPYLTRWFVAWGWTPNQVTYLMIAIGASSGMSLLAGGIVGGIAAALLAQLQMIIDCCDGEVARWRQQYSPVGFFLDKVAHYVAESLVPLGLGLRAAGGLQAFSGAAQWWPFLGALLALLVVWNKALNDAVHVARAANNLPRLTESQSVNRPTRKGLARLRALTRFFPFQRIFHSVEMSFVAAVAAVGDHFIGQLKATHFALSALLVLAVVTVVGHFASIMSSSRLR